MVRSRYLQAQHSDPSLFFLSRAYLLRANQLILCGLLYSGGICSIVPIPGSEVARERVPDFRKAGEKE